MMRRTWLQPVTQEAQRHYICSACRYRYRAISRGKGIRELRQFHGFSIDLPGKQFRKEYSFFGLIAWYVVIPFDSEKGFRLHKAMHRALFTEKLKPVEWQLPKKMP